MKNEASYRAISKSISNGLPGLFGVGATAAKWRTEVRTTNHPTTNHPAVGIDLFADPRHTQNMRGEQPAGSGALRRMWTMCS